MESRAPKQDAVDTVRAMYADAGEPDKFATDVDEYFRHGLVIGCQRAFMMARPITLADGQPAWHFKSTAGELRLLAGMLPKDLPYIAFGRREDGRIRAYPTDKFISTIKKVTT